MAPAATALWMCWLSINLDGTFSSKGTGSFISSAKVILKYYCINVSTRTMIRSKSKNEKCCLALTKLFSVTSRFQTAAVWLASIMVGGQVRGHVRGHVPQVARLSSPAVTSDTPPCHSEILYILSPVISLLGGLNPLLLNIFVPLSIMIDPQELSRMLYA